MKKNLFHLFVSLLGLFIVGEIDRLTGWEISLSLFYLGPIAYAVWFSSFPAGFILAFLSAAVWLLADISSGHIYSNSLIPIWNALTRLLIFLIVVFLLKRIKEQISQEQMLSRTDYITGIGNSRYFLECLEQELQRAKRYHRSFSVAYLDIDDFKEINDTYGHSTGDKLLHLIGQSIKENIRDTDIAGRLGGDEFGMIFLEASNEKKGEVVMNRLQHGLLTAVQKNSHVVTFSMGMVVFADIPENTDKVLELVDRLMYDAKKSGKNAVKTMVYTNPKATTARPGLGN